MGWVQDDSGVAAVLGLARVRGEDALPLLVQGLSAAREVRGIEDIVKSVNTLENKCGLPGR